MGELMDTVELRRILGENAELKQEVERCRKAAEQDDEIIRRLQTRIGSLLSQARDSEIDRDYNGC